MSTSPARQEVARARALLGSAVTEKEFQATVLELATRLRWRTFHVLDSKGSTAGFPDVVAVRRTRLVVAELKTEKGKLTDAQQSWMADLEQVLSVGAYVWKPSDWAELEAVLR